ncbi:hypothetical protein L484_007733 [Morus notabilis]|uniref:Uncharacterized protein n=1 Tax=Morus notabilis TaxID=981085 RepID=W9R6G4_9ROSA|nr:hypothetical protein L484_007733 [Morus notabilis]
MARNRVPIQGHIAMQKPESYGTVSGDAAVEVEETPVDKSAMLNQGNGVGQASASQKSSFCLSNLLESYTVDYSGYLQVKIRAAFYPKFENEKSDQEFVLIALLIDFTLVDLLETMQVSLKHSGPLFMYAGNGGAYAKKSFGNIYTAVGVFVLGRTLQEAWGAEAAKKQAEFDELLEEIMDSALRKIMVLSFLSSMKKRLWKSVASFFAAYGALCEEGTAHLYASVGQI